MIQRGDGSRLSLKALIEIALSDLDRDDPIQTGVASLPHFSHTTGAETRQDFVRSEFLAGGERHSRIQFSRSNGNRIGNEKRASVSESRGNGSVAIVQTSGHGKEQIQALSEDDSEITGP